MIDKSDIKQWLESNGYYASDDNEMSIDMIEQCFNDLQPQWVSVDVDSDNFDSYPNKSLIVDCMDLEGIRILDLHWVVESQAWQSTDGSGVEYSYNYFTHWMEKPETPK